MREVKIKLYELQDLKNDKNAYENAQKNIIKLMQENAQERLESYCDFDMNDDMEAEAQALLDEFFPEEDGWDTCFTNIYWSLCDSQGDGAMFEFNATQEKNNNTVYDFVIKKIGRCCHECSWDYDYYGGKEMPDLIRKNIIKMYVQLADYGYLLINRFNAYKDDYTPEEIQYFCEQEGIFFTQNGNVITTDILF